MKESSDQDATEPSSEEEQDLEATSRKRRFRAAFGFLRSPSFWGGLVVGLVALGVGVVIGLGMDRWMDGDRGKDDGWGREPTIHSFRMDDGEWLGEGPFGPDGKRFWFRFPAGKRGDWMDGWEGRKPSGSEEFERDGFSWRDGPREGGSYLSDEELALLERFIDVIEEVVDYLERGGFDSRGERQFGPAWFFEDDFWKDFEGRLFGDEYRRGDKESKSDPEGSWEEDRGSWDEEEGPFGDFGFPFGEFLPGFAFLEDCELDSLELPRIFEDLPDEEDGLEDDQSMEDFFEQIEELFREACEQPSDG